MVTVNTLNRLGTPGPNEQIHEPVSETAFLDEREGFHSPCGQAFIRVPACKHNSRRSL